MGSNVYRRVKRDQGVVKTFLISNSEKIARWANSAGVTWLMVDFETLGKRERQSGTSGWISDHTLGDCRRLRPILTATSLAVRINPIHSTTEAEIDEAIDAGVDMIMLPMAKTLREIETFSDLVGDRADKALLVETPELLARLPWILERYEFETIHLGLNDLSLSLGLRHMFQTFVTGYVSLFTNCAIRNRVGFGLGGIGRLDADLPIDAYDILVLHAALGSGQVILSRSFMADLDSEESFIAALTRLRQSYQDLVELDVEELRALERKALVKLNRLGSPDSIVVE